MRFYLGVHHPNWLTSMNGVPLFVSHRWLARRKTLPVAVTRWALDSGAYTELLLHGRWRSGPVEYAAAVRRYAEQIGRMDFAAQQDWMTEDHILSRTGLSIGDHQRRTTDNYLALQDLAPDLPIVPVLQGQSVADYLRHVERYHRLGVNLAARRLVGVGSVCRRQHTREIHTIVAALHALGLRLHGFGVKTTGLAQYGSLLTSADSMAWSYAGRRTPGCTPSHASEANCPRYALAWYTRLHATLSPAGPGDVHPTRRPPTPATAAGRAA